MKLTNEQLEAVAKLVLSRNVHFMKFLEALGDHGELLMRRIIYETDAAQVELLRGMLRNLTDIMEMVEQAPDRLKQLQEKT